MSRPGTFASSEPSILTAQLSSIPSASPFNTCPVGLFQPLLHLVPFPRAQLWLQVLRLAPEQPVPQHGCSPTRSPYLHDGSDLLPLVWSGVCARGVVRAGVEDEDGELRSFLVRERVSVRRTDKAQHPHCRRAEVLWAPTVLLAETL